MPKRMISMWQTKLSIVSLVAIFFLFLSPFSASAADFYLNRFDSVIQVNADGSFDVTETILADFAEPKHGLYRVIPTHYRTDEGRVLEIGIDTVSVTDLVGTPIETSISNNEAFSLRIGNADVTVLGPQYYVIHYRVRGALVELSDRVELYWNVTGTEWETAPSAASVHVRLPEGTTYAKDELQLACYTGPAGSLASDCTTALVGKDMMAGTSNDFLTVAFAWPKGLVIVPPPMYQSTILGGLPRAFSYLLWLIPLATFFLMYRRWRRHGRDPKGRGTIVPEYEPPKGMKAAEVGGLLDKQVNFKDLSAAIIELAVQGYVRITEQVEERFGPDRKTFILDKEKEIDETLRPWEQSLMQALFSTSDHVTEDELKKSFSKSVGSVSLALADQLVTDGYYPQRPGLARAPYLIAGFGIIFSAVVFAQVFFAFIQSWVGLGACILTGAIIAAFGLVMDRRTEKGVQALEQTRGFKLFLGTAEKYRLKWQEQEGIFEKYLPYAMVFGIADKWAKEFAAVHAEPIHPAWYVGPSLMHFNPVDFTSHMNALSQQMAAVAAPKSGASGGGGSSGGGFGGGGGGSW